MQLGLKVTALFDPSIDNNGANKAQFKEAGLVEIIEDYNRQYGQNFTLPLFAKMKKDIANRLAHKKPYNGLEQTPEKQIDLLIVVDQMLTGFDSKWINTLYLDKMLEYENLIQAFCGSFYCQRGAQARAREHDDDAENLSAYYSGTGE